MCKYCEKQEKIKEEYFDITIVNNSLVVGNECSEGCGYDKARFNINYCPMCRKGFEKMITEEWKDIRENNKYQISNTGKIRSKDKTTIRKDGKPLTTKGRILKVAKDTKGYLRTTISNKTVKIHRLVAETFIENPNNLPEVNHIDGNKKNNCVDNLEWISHIDNVKHAKRVGLYNKRPKIRRDNKGRFVGRELGGNK